jgi:hypothetical protein
MTPIKGLTYGTIEDALTRLGFTVHVDNRARIYRHPGGALIALPPVGLNDDVLRHHLFSASTTVDNFGLMDRYDFEFLLLQLGTPSEKVAA